jgi:hypothetical protein
LPHQKNEQGFKMELKQQKEIMSLIKRNEPLTGNKLDLVLSILEFDGDESVCKLYKAIEDKLKAAQPLSNYEIYLMNDRVSSIDYEEKRKERKSNGARYSHITRRLNNNEPLTGKTLELALELVNVIGDDEQSKFIRNIGTKLKTGQQLDEYEHHIMVDVLMLHARLSV